MRLTIAILALLALALATALPAHLSEQASAAPAATIQPSPASTAAPTAASPRRQATTTAAVPDDHTRTPLRKRFKARPDDRVSQITPGVIHVRRTTDDPLKINILLFDLTAPEFDLQAAIGDGWLSGRHRTSSMAAQNHALAAVNGDLFSGDGIPQGLTIIDSQVVTAPKYRATFAWSRSREPFIGYFTDQWTWQAEVIASDGARRPLYHLNTPCVDNGLCLFNEFARSVPAHSNDVKVLLDNSNRVTAIVRGARTRVLSDTLVLEGRGTAASWLLKHVEVGDRPTITITTNQPLSQFTQAISGGPIILRDGRFVQDCLCALRDCSSVHGSLRGARCEDFTTDWKERHYLWVRMPRTGIGFDKARQTLIIAVVDGYQRGYSRGITQEEFADLLHEFGADTAMELDGGGSTTMVLKDRIVNRPSDETGERYVANALLFFWND